MEPAGAGEPAPPALLRVGGALVARHQIALALAAGCGRIICVSRESGPEMAELQDEAERGGASFHVIAGARSLSPFISAADEVLVIADGLLPTTGDALRLLEGPPAILVLPADSAVPAGFERIDINHAAGGLMLLPGRLVDRLMELPADVDPAAALLRIALQAGVPLRMIPEALQTDERWLLIRTEADAQLAEDRWIVRHTAGGAQTLGPVLAKWMVRRFGAALLHGGGGSLIVAGIATLLGVIALATAWYGHIVAALVFAGIGWALQLGSNLLASLQRDALGQKVHLALRVAALGAVFDSILIAVLGMGGPNLPGETLAERSFAPLVLVGLLRLLPRILSGGAGEWLEDRLAAIALLAAMAAGGVLDIGIPALIVLLLVIGIAWPVDRKRDSSPNITRA